MRPIDLYASFLLILLWGILLGFVCRIASLRFGLITSWVLGVLYLFGAVFLFKIRDIWTPITVPLFFQAPMAFIGAVTIQYAHLIKEMIGKLRMEKDLSHARDIQVSMMQESCPEIPGYQIAPFSTPAREVSGDFYDFIDID